MRGRGFRIGLASLVVAAAAAACSSSPSGTPPGTADSGGQPIPALSGATPAEAAAKSLVEFRAAVSADNAEALGFASPEEAARAELGPSLPIAVLTVARLQAWDGNGPPDQVWIRDGLAIYEVVVDGIVRSSIEVARAGGAWQGDRFGSPHLIEAIAAVSADGDVVVEMPEMNLVFLARGSGAELTLATVFDAPSLGFVAGEPVAAKEVLSTLRAHQPEPSTLN
jgi:hypothetical protein